ncbi:MAG: hypothetical protein GX202_07620 [Firmicutes bacterium]|nr:hypothetical protein [Bacillota bacterium]
MTEKYRIKKTPGQQGISRKLDNNSYQAGPHHTIRPPQDQAAYDPWADWFNAGLDPEPFAGHFYIDPAESNPPMFFDEGQDWRTPWFVPDEEQQPQAAEIPPTEAQQEYHAYPWEEQSFGHPGYQVEQDNQAWRPVEAEEKADDTYQPQEETHRAFAGPAVTEGEMAAPDGIASPGEEDSRVDETTPAATETGPETEMGVQEGKTENKPLVWKAFPEKSC